MHPFVDMIEGASPDSRWPFLAYAYFSEGEAKRCDTDGGTYAVHDAQTVHRTNYQWKHKVADIISAVGGAGLRIKYLHEFPYLFCDIWNWPPGGIVGRMEQDEDGWWWPTVSRDFVPLMFSLQAHKDK